MYELRSYQKDLIAKIVNSMKNGHKSIVVQSPPSYWEDSSNGRDCKKNHA